MSDHCSEYDLEIMHLSPETLSVGEKERIMSHLEECPFCKEHFDKLQQFYQNLDETLKSSPTQRDSTFAHRLLSRSRLSLPGRKAELGEKSDSLIETFAEVIEPYRRSLIERVIRYVRVHPVRSAGMISFAAIVLALSVITIRPKFDKNPGIVEAKDGFLIVNNNHGDELWRKYIAVGFSMAGTDLEYHPERAISVQDLDGDGTNEILSIFGWIGPRIPFNNLLVCYNSDGTERWKYELHRTMKLGAILYSDDYRFYHMEEGDFGRSGSPEIIAAARHETWNPNVLVRLDGKSGNVLSEFWHPGELKQFERKDLDHDGVDDLVYGGQNNRLQYACLVVFDPRKIEGSAPATKEYYPQGFPVGTEKYYIIFPASDLSKFSADVTDEVVGLRIASDGMIEVIVNEPLRRGGGTLYYYFDSSLNCISVRPSDSFTASHKLLENEGKLTTRLNDEYFEALRKGVLYWDGEKFVDHLTMNRHYLEAMKPLPIP